MTAEEDIKQASIGFDLVFSNDLDAAKYHLSSNDSPFHLMGLGCVVFLQAALGMETALISEASRLLTLAEAKAKKEAKAAKSMPHLRRFAPGLYFEILQADAILLLGFTQTLSETYAGYLQCMYSLNNAHTKFTRVYKAVFPDGVDSFATPSTTPAPSRKASFVPLSTVSPSQEPPPPKDVLQSTSSSDMSSSLSVPSSSRSDFFSRFTSFGTKSSARATQSAALEPDGSVEELIISGAAFGFGLFNLVLSLLSPKVRGIIGFFGFDADRSLALRALAVAATRNDVHAVFAGLVLMSYHGAILSLSGYQADEAHVLKQYRAIVDKLEEKYSSGSLWTLHRAKILRLSYDLDGAIAVLRKGLSPERSHTFMQADALLVFELAWTLLAQRRYQEAAEMWFRMTELNTWSHAMYYYMAAGCYISLGNVTEAQKYLDKVPALLEKRKFGGRDLPTEVFIRRKIAFYKQKQVRRGGAEADYAASVCISLAEELGIFWNMHDRISRTAAEAYIQGWLGLSPPVTYNTPYTIPLVNGLVSTSPDLDTADELALRSLLLGIVHRSLAHYKEASSFLKEAVTRSLEAKWIGGVACIELATLQLKVADASNLSHDTEAEKKLWATALHEASQLLDQASGLCANTELSSRLDSRISFMRDEIALKKVRLEPTAEGKK